MPILIKLKPFYLEGYKVNKLVEKFELFKWEILLF